MGWVGLAFTFSVPTPSYRAGHSQLSLLAAFGIAMIVLAVGIYLGQIAVNAPSDAPPPTFDATDGNSFDAIVQGERWFEYCILLSQQIWGGNRPTGRASARL